MLIVRCVKNWLLLLRRNWKFAMMGLIAGALAWQALARYAPKRYAGTALVTLNLTLMSLDQPASAGELSQQSAMAVQLKKVASQVDWNGIATRHDPYPEIQSPNGTARVAAYLASQVSIAPVAASEMSGNVARVSYSGSDPEVVSSVVGEVADALVKPTFHLASPKPVDVPVSNSVVLPEPPTPVGIPRHLTRRGRVRWERHHAGALAPVRTTPATKKAVLTTPSENIAALDHALQNSLGEGVKLQEAFTQSSSTVTSLKTRAEEQQKRVQQPVAAATRVPPEHKQTPQEERLHQDLARAQRELTVLRDRYTDQYPDVVAATERVQGLLLDMSRIAADTPSAPAAQNRQQAAQDLGILLQQLNDAEALQTRLQTAVDRNRDETSKLRARLALATHSGDSAGPSAGMISNEAASTAMPPVTAISDSTTASPAQQDAVSNRTPANPTADEMVSPFFLVQQPEVTTKPLIFATQFLWPLSLVFGILAAVLAAWLAEQRDPSIRNEIMLRRELPASAVYLGGIPRIRHEVIAD